jgi:hypothetical protein
MKITSSWVSICTRQLMYEKRAKCLTIGGIFLSG